RDGRRHLLGRPSRVSSCDNDVDLEPDELGCDLAETLSASLRPAILDCDGTPLDPSELAQSLHKSAGEVSPTCGGAYSQEANGRQPAALLRARRERPCCRAAEQRSDELAPLHSITSSARASTVAGMSRPNAFPVLRLTTSSYFVGACTGRSAGFSPLRMRSTYPAAR